MNEHDVSLSEAFDQQAPKFEKAPVQSDPVALERLVRFADLPPGSRVLDAGCGPGLVAEALLEAGCDVVGVDLSAEMLERARRRCARFGDRARFHRASVFDSSLEPGFDATISRYVLHHVQDPRAFLLRQASVVRPGGVVVLCDHTTDPDPARAAWHQEIERLRDHTHRTNLTAGAVIDLFAAVGLVMIRSAEERFELDFDEWFDRGSPSSEKAVVRTRLLSGMSARGWCPVVDPTGAIRIECWRVMVRGMRPHP